jgi:hypothetical protein
MNERTCQAAHPDRDQWPSIKLAIGVSVLLTMLVPASGARRGDKGGQDAMAIPQSTSAVAGCSGRIANHRLDFWLGDWIVYARGSLDGTNHIVSILGGCAVQEEWTDISGYQGRSWFYVDPATGRMKQLWLTSHAEQLGGTKEKTELPGGGPHSVQFQGVLVTDTGARVVERTTLTLTLDDTVHQIIQTSKDEGRTWGGEYDAVYRRSSPKWDRQP